MEPETRFCTSADGTRIALSTYGEPSARALVVVSAFECAQEAAWNYPRTRALNEGLASGRRYVNLDRRGVGSSQREVDDLTIPAQVADLAAVIAELGLESFDLMVCGNAGPLGLAYVVEHPKRVDRMVLFDAILRTSDAPPLGVQEMAKSIRTNWSLARRSLAAVAFPSGPADLQRWLSNTMRDSVTPEMAARHFEVVAEFDARAILPSVRAPTLVLAVTGAHEVDLASVRTTASLIPRARLVTLEGDLGVLYVDPSPLLAALRTFLDEGTESVAEALAASGLVTILFTDIESSTALTQRLGDAKAQELLRAHNAIVRDALKACGGSEIKHTGDGIMASFPSASGALECAVAIQQAVAGRSTASDQPSGLRVRIGLNAGEPVAEEQDLFGTAVQLASRICDRAEGGEILASDVVRQLAAGKGFLFSDIGDTELRGFEDPVRLFEVRWRAERSP